MFAVIGTLAALHERTDSGRGQEVDVAIYEAVAALMESSMADFELGGVLRGRSGGVLPGVAPSNAYPTADGADVLIAGNADAVFARLCQAMGRPELATDDALRHPRRPRCANGRARRDRSPAWTATLTADAVLSTLARARRARRPGVHRRRHARRPAVPRPRDGAAAPLAESVSTRRCSASSRSSHARPARSSTSARPSANTAPSTSPENVRRGQTPADIPGRYARRRWSGPSTVSARSTRASG